MIIIHVVNDLALPRAALSKLEQHLRVMSATVVTGARQTGKSTLVQQLGGERRRYVTLDDLDALTAARNDPGLLVDGPQPVTLDEVQREPQLMHAIKRSIDRERRPGQFLLTGSANLLLSQRVTESLAGRAGYLNLWPMSRREQLGQAQAGSWERLLDTPPDEWIDLLRSIPSEPEDWRALARRGGFPTPALQLQRGDDRAIWFDGYVRTYLERDLQDLSNISALPDFRRLMRAACLRVGQLLNQTALGRDIALTQPTTHRYLNLLEASYMFVRLPAFANNRTKRLVKSPKAYWGDTGLAMHLSQETEPRGEHLENIVLHDLLVWRDSRTDQANLFYWRTRNGEEIDFVVESAGQLLPIEVKSSVRPRLNDARHLRTFLAQFEDVSLPGLLLHTGDEPSWIAPNVLAAPWWMVV